MSGPSQPPAPLSWLLVGTRAVVVGFFVVMIVVTFLQVVLRYVFAAPLAWSEELARYSFVWVVFLGAALGLERGIHLGVDLLVSRLSAPLQRGVEWLCDLLIVAFSLTVLYASLPVLEVNAFQRSPAIGLAMSNVYAAIPVSMGLIATITAGRLVSRLSPRRRRSEEPGPCS